MNTVENAGFARGEGCKRTRTWLIAGTTKTALTPRARAILPRLAVLALCILCLFSPPRRPRPTAHLPGQFRPDGDVWRLSPWRRRRTRLSGDWICRPQHPEGAKCHAAANAGAAPSGSDAGAMVAGHWGGHPAAAACAAGKRRSSLRRLASAPWSEVCRPGLLFQATALPCKPRCNLSNHVLNGFI